MNPTSVSARLRTLAVLIASLGLAAGAQASVEVSQTPRADRSALYAAEGAFTLDDGRELSLRVMSRSVVVRIAEQEERWQPVAPNVVASPDGRQRLHLHRDANGVVDRISLETKLAR